MTRPPAPHIDASTPVLVLGGRQGALGVARSLGRLGVPVYAIYEEPPSQTRFSRYWKETLRWDFSRPTPGLLDFLDVIGRRIGRPALLIPATDALAMFVAEHADALTGPFVFPRLSPHLVFSLLSKREMFYLATRIGIPTARTAFPRSEDEVPRLLDTVPLPIMVKGIDPRLPGGKVKAIVRSERALRAAVDGADITNVMIQEYIPGNDDAVWMFNGYFDREADCLAGFTGRKLRQWPPYRGVTSLGICARNDLVADLTKRFMKTVGYHGILDVGYRYDARDGRYKILDVNPRVGATFRLFLGRGGMDVVRAFYLDMTQQPVPPDESIEGRKWLLEEDIFSCRQYWRDGNLTFAGWAKSLWGIQEAAWFAFDDPAPFVSWAAGVMGRLARALVGGRNRAARGLHAG